MDESPDVAVGYAEQLGEVSIFSSRSGISSPGSMIVSVMERRFAVPVRSVDAARLVSLRGDVAAEALAWSMKYRSSTQ